MAERTWTYLLPTGERLEARLDLEGDVESVYLGPRLVSRSAGRKVGGHAVVFLHGEAAGPFRGGTAARVVFRSTPPACEVTVGDRPLDPSEVPAVAQPKGVPPDAVVVNVATSRGGRRVLGAMVVALVGGGAAVYLADQQYRVRAIGGEPLTERAVTPNGMLRVHHSPDFHPTVRRMPNGGGDVVTLVRDGHEGEIVMIAIPRTTAPNAPRLEAALATGASEPWARPDTEVLRGVGTIETCFDDGAVTRLRVATIDSRPFDVWSCTFVRRARGYRFVTIAPPGKGLENAVLRRVVLATDLL
jgi:hypothetical protein